MHTNTLKHTKRFMKQFYTTQSSFSLLFTKYGTKVTGVIPGPLSFFSTPVVICLCVSAWERVSGMIQMYQTFLNLPESIKLLYSELCSLLC